MHPMLTIAIRAARAGGDLALRYIDRIDTLSVTTKQQNDFVSEVDQMAEQEIIQCLHKSYPDHGILAEESGAQGGNDEYVWIIDPLDGTTNFLHGIPHFAVSLALEHRGRLEQAVIYDPLRQELFTATRGAGAQLNKKRLRINPKKSLVNGLIGTGFPFRHHQHFTAYMDMFQSLFPKVADIRRAGAASLDLAYVAAGRLDGFWEIGLKPWDMAAGALLIREAGGLVTDFSGNDQFLSTGNIVAGAPKVCAEIIQTIQPHLGTHLAS